jgi:mono/diheme cytochrome c family protein
MKRFLKVLGTVVVLLVALAVAAIFFFFPRSRAASAESIERTPERVARGRYLVEHVSDCVACHSERLVDRYAMPIRPGTEGGGGLDFSEGKLRLFTANITPDRETGIGAWSDGEIMRAIREGVRRDGQAIFPSMPYQLFAQLSDDDTRAIVAYLRTIPPLHKSIPPREVPPPMNVIMRFIPKPLAGPVAEVDRKNSVAYGKYLTTVAGCVFCHSPKDDHMQNLAGREFSGGFEMKGQTGRVVTANITPHPETFVGRSSRADFIAHFKSMQSMNAANAPVMPKGRNTIMPWLAYSGMTEEDLGAIYDYLRTVKPVENKVNSFPDAR